MTSVVKPTQQSIEKAVALLSKGELVAFPTETVYGLGADATLDAAVRKIYAAKGRPSFNPLICHFYSMDQLEKDVILSPLALKLARAFWPGPLTLVLPRKEGSGISMLCSANLPSLAVRIPSHPVAQDLLKAFNKPIAAPSANRSGKISPTKAEDVLQELEGRLDLILDAGPTPVGLESTVISLAGDKPLLLRPGYIDRKSLEVYTGPLEGLQKKDRLLSPGLLKSHYAPNASLRLNVQNVREGEVLLAFGPTPMAGARKALNLSPTGDLEEAAQNLYSYLRDLDKIGVDTIAVMPIPNTGIGEAINDRLKRAAAEKDR